MKRIFIELIYTNSNFSGIGKSFSTRTKAVEHLRELRKELGDSVTAYNEDFLFILYRINGSRMEIDLEGSDLQ